jgi:hypothetical protein
MTAGLFINTTKANCSIYESGEMIINAIQNSSKYKLDVLYQHPKDKQFEIPNYYDFYIFNWHHVALPIPLEKIQELPGKKISILLEISPDSVFNFAHDDWFDAYIAIDPTKSRLKNIYPFPRPLEIIQNPKPLLDKLSFGSFGLHIPGKRFEDIIKVATSLNEDCIVRINICQGDYVGYQDIDNHFKVWRKLAGPKVDLRLTSDCMDKQDLISWCSEHTLNVFPYYRSQPGLSATTDQAISTGRALAVSYCDTFRHIHKYISYFPKQTYLQLIESTPSGVKQMQEDWHPSKFLESFENMLIEEKVL